ncbi:MAG: hypothetical protein ACRDBF_13625, partial [Plesiomonas shigelloides]
KTKFAVTKRRRFGFSYQPKPLTERRDELTSENCRAVQINISPAMCFAFFLPADLFHCSSLF